MRAGVSVNRRFRLTRSTDFMRVRRMGKSYAHPLVVLIAHPNHENSVRIGVTAGRSVGGAVVRNRVKRRLREIMRPLLPSIRSGWDIALVARKPAAECGFSLLKQAVENLLVRAGVLRDEVA